VRGSSPTAAGMVSQGIGGHEGWSGTPFWKIQAQAAQQRELLLQESLAYVSERKPIVPPNVLVEAACVGGSAGEGSKPFCRHVLIKCLRRVSDRMRVELPTTGLFASQAPLGLFALFDGQQTILDSRALGQRSFAPETSIPRFSTTSRTFLQTALVIGL